MENSSESRSAAGGRKEEVRAGNSQLYSPSRATSPTTEDDMDVDLLDYEEGEGEEEEEEEDSLLVDLLEDEDDWSRNLGGVKEMLDPDGGNPVRAAVGRHLCLQVTESRRRAQTLIKMTVIIR
jgi:hypothetical protein